MAQSTKTALAVVAIIVAAAAFWLLLLSPKRDKAGELSEQVSAAKSTLATEKARAGEGVAAKKKFRRDYQQLVLLGKAVPAEAETASLLVQLNALGRSESTPLVALSNEGGGGEEAEPTTETGAPAETAALQKPPLGSKVGPAGFRAMPMKLGYVGGYFPLVELMGRIDGLVATKRGRVAANGRLVTINSFFLKPVDNLTHFNVVSGGLSVTTYTTPPDQGLTAGASLAGPGAEGSTQ
jgi:type II secretory pathway pseudopilin PulG